MATDISKSTNGINVTVDGGNPIVYVGRPAKYSFNSAGTILNVSFGYDSYEIPIADLRVAGAGTAPASAAAGYTALAAVFGIFP